MVNYSALNMLDAKAYVDGATSPIRFAGRWIKCMSGKGSLVIHLPPSSKAVAEDICKTVRKLSKRRFVLSSLVAYQVDELLKEQEISPNLYSFKKSLTQIENTPSIKEHYDVVNKKLKRVHISLPKLTVYRLEFLLAYMNEELGKHEYTVERLLELNIMDLLNEIAQGRAESTVQDILDGLKVSKKMIEDYSDEKGEDLLA